MLNVIIYAYTQKIYSSRQIAKQLKENSYFMWLARHQKPDFRTINRFRSERMKEVIYETFFSIVDLHRDHGFVKLEDYFLDGTKVEANANKYTFVWNKWKKWEKSTERYEKLLDEKYIGIMNEIEQVTKEDEASEKEQDPEEKLNERPVTSKQIKKSVEQLEERLEKEPENRKIKKAKYTLEKDPNRPKNHRIGRPLGLFKFTKILFWRKKRGRHSDHYT